MKLNWFSLLFVILVVVSCADEDYLPKPKAYLRLDYPEPKYASLNLNVPFDFQVNQVTKNIIVKPIKAPTESYGIDLDYPVLKGTVFLTYKAIKNNKDHLLEYLRDADKFTFEHTRKADDIPVFPFENKLDRVFGQLSEVKGNVASPVQFYVTDSINHFLIGSLYFKVKPNYDSIFPAIQYVKKDVEYIMETLKWKE